uniref:Uncharacterized protein n=1 Tax=Setaria italica TaxID=4555 RepID=K4AKU9_SETIT
MMLTDGVRGCADQDRVLDLGGLLTTWASCRRCRSRRTDIVQAATALTLVIFMSPGGIFSRGKALFYLYYGILIAVIIFGFVEASTSPDPARHHRDDDPLDLNFAHCSCGWTWRLCHL